MTWQVMSVVVRAHEELDTWFNQGWEPISVETLRGAFGSYGYEWHLRRSAVEEAPHAGVVVAFNALEDLALRLWAGDKPVFDGRVSSIDEWVDGLPEAEAAAVNGMLGVSFGRRKDVHWEGSHPVVEAMRGS